MNGTSREILDLVPNEAQVVAIKYSEPKIVANGRAMFSLVDGRILFLDPPIAEKIIALGVRTGEPFAICLRWNGKKAAPKIYDVWRESDAAEEPEPPPSRFGPQPNGTYAVPAQPESRLERQLRESIDRGKAGASVSAPAPVAPTAIAGASANGQTSHVPQYNGLEAQACALIDVFAGCLRHAATHEGVDIAVEDVRSILLSCYINGPRNGGAR